MFSRYFLPTAVAAGLAAGSASAATFTTSASFSGDLCATDSNRAGGFDDCATIAGNTGTVGVYELLLTGLDTAPASDVTLRLTSTFADLFNTNGTDNSIERFRLIIGGQNFGRLFDGSAADETTINAELGASVAQNIADNIARPVANRSAGPVDISFDISAALFDNLRSGDSLSVELDFRQDLNINAFFDPTVSVSYSVAAVPLPATGMMLLAGLGGMAALRRRKAPTA